MNARASFSAPPVFAAALAAFLSVTAALPAIAGVEFAQPVSYALSAAGYSVALGDLDGDGDLDATTGTGSRVHVFLNRGDGVYDPAPAVETGPHLELEIARLDGDGIADLALAGPNGVAVYRGLGTGGFEFLREVALEGAGPITSADFDGDGLTDLAVGVSSGYGAKVAVLLQRAGGFDVSLIPLQAGEVSAIEAGNLDGDLRADLVIGSYGKASVLLSTGGGTFAPEAIYSVYGVISGVAIGRLNGDPFPDVALSDAAGTMNVLRNIGGNGTFMFAGNTRLYGVARHVALADFDKDGKADVAVTRDDLGQVIALGGRGDGTFNAPPLYFATGMGANGLACGDVNGDGRPDLVTADGALSMSVLISGALRNCRRDDLPSGVGASGIAAADFNGDGVLDVASANEDNKLSVMLADAVGGFLPGVTYPLGTLSQNLATGDFDNDSRPDLVAPNFDQSTISIYRNAGDGSFLPAEILATGSHPRFVEVTDVNGDGRPDLVTANYGNSYSPGSVSVFFNRGGNHFSNPDEYPVGVGPYEVRAGNLDGDDNVDLVVNNYDGTSVSVLINRGNGKFKPEVRYGAGWNLSSAIADFDHDGDNDFAVANFKENTVMVFKNDGAGAFALFATIPVGRQPRSLQAAIIKGDGDMDLAVAQSALNNVTLLENDGTGLFTARPTGCGVGVNPKNLIMADFDGNGGQDLATANTGAGTVSILREVGPPGSATSKAAGLKRPRKLDATVVAHRFALAPGRPNPARGEAAFPFELAREGPVELRVYDVAGRAVRTLVNGTLPAGAHEARWDGTTDRGGRASPGTYFIRLRSGDERAVRTLMLQ